MKKLKTNRIRCKHCGTVIESKNTYDFIRCDCGKVAVDGGLEYPKRVYPAGRAEDHYEDLSEFD
ncbi:DUF7695 domain-containing protein [Ornithinibacillus californiensis]|uniref:DUF7695 domain-containing protein n=1 Tax=Ornithinibacillus californiensis TaxID=161536 RepID=UPI00069FA76B|nr:hypothetical protein [Ornithinibacillus californiensis]